MDRSLGTGFVVEVPNRSWNSNSSYKD